VRSRQRKRDFVAFNQNANARIDIGFAKDAPAGEAKENE